MIHTIPLRETLDPSIFDEMKETYPTISKNGVQYKQTCSFFGVPCDFNFPQFSLDCLGEGVDPCQSFSVYMYLIREMSVSYGFYFIFNRLFPQRVSLELQIDGGEVQKIFDFLVKCGYVYNFNNKITCTISVRNYECVSSSRISNRSRKKSTTTTTEVTPPPLPEELVNDDDVELPEISDEDIQKIKDGNIEVKPTETKSDNLDDVIEELIEVDGLF